MDDTFTDNFDSTAAAKMPMKNFPTEPLIDDQPWMPIQPSLGPVNFSSHESSVKYFDSLSPPRKSQLNADFIGMQISPRNKIRPPIHPLTKQRPKLPPTLYQSFSNPGLMYGTHEVENLGNGLVKPYPIPVDLIGEQNIRTTQNDLVLNKGEVLINDFTFKGSPAAAGTTETVPRITAPTVSEETVESDESTVSDASTSTESSTERITSTSPSIPTSMADDSSDASKFSELLMNILNESASSNATDTSEAELRTEDIDLDAQETVSESKVETNEEPLSSRTEDIDLPDDHTEALEEIATAISSMGTLSFKNIKDYIMATTKSLVRETMTEQTTVEARSEHSNSSMSATMPSPRTKTTTATTTTGTAKPITEPNDDVEHSTNPYVEVETVQYNPSAHWNQPSLFPSDSQWEYVNGSLVHPDKASTQRVFNETLQAWIVESPPESRRHISTVPSPIHFERINEPLKNISAIFDTLASRLNLEPNGSTRLPPSMSQFIPAHVPEMRQPPKVQTVPTASTTKSTPAEEELPVLLSHSREESFYPSSAETVLGQAEVEVVDPTQYEQMLLIDRVSAALRPSSTPSPSLVTLMPVKSNSGLRSSGADTPELISSRGFPPPSKLNKKRIEETSFVVRTNINVSSQ